MLKAHYASVSFRRKSKYELDVVIIIDLEHARCSSLGLSNVECK
jgi:hypothetical protein